MFSKEEIRLVLVIVVCSTILIASGIYFSISPSQKTGFFQISLTSPNGTILPPELNVNSDQNNVLTIAVQNSMGKTQTCRLDTELIILNSSGSSLNSIMLENNTLILNNTATWTKTFTYQINNNIKNNTTIKEIFFDNYTTNISENQYNQSLLFQFRFDLWVFNNSINNYTFTNTWVSSPFLNATT